MEYPKIEDYNGQASQEAPYAFYHSPLVSQHSPTRTGGEGHGVLRGQLPESFWHANYQTAIQTAIVLIWGGGGGHKYAAVLHFINSHLTPGQMNKK